VIAKHAEDSPEVRWEIESEWATREMTRVYVRLLDGSGRVVAQTPGMADQLPPEVFPNPLTVQQARAGDGRDLRSRAGRPFCVMAATAASARGEPRVIQVAMDETLERAPLARYLRGAWTVLLVASVLSAMAGYFLARKSIRPVEQITEAARHVRPATLHERIAGAGDLRVAGVSGVGRRRRRNRLRVDPRSKACACYPLARYSGRGLGRRTSSVAPRQPRRTLTRPLPDNVFHRRFNSWY
jgi:hypothetical protein